MKKFRVYNTVTDETVMFFEAENIFEASVLVGKWYGADNTEYDVESVATYEERKIKEV